MKPAWVYSDEDNKQISLDMVKYMVLVALKYVKLRNATGPHMATMRKHLPALTWAYKTKPAIIISDDNGDKISFDMCPINGSSHILCICTCL